MKINLLLLIAFFLPLLLSAREQKQVSGTVADQYGPASFPLLRADQAATVYVVAKDAEVVRIAEEAFRKDLESVTAHFPGVGNLQDRLKEFSVFIGPTRDRIEKELASDSLVYRYRPEIAAPDGFIGQGYASHVGLYAEQPEFQGEHLWNLRQAFSHLGLISAAYNLDQQLNDSRNKNAKY